MAVEQIDQSRQIFYGFVHNFNKAIWCFSTEYFKRNADFFLFEIH